MGPHNNCTPLCGTDGCDGRVREYSCDDLLAFGVFAHKQFSLAAGFHY